MSAIVEQYADHLPDRARRIIKSALEAGRILLDGADVGNLPPYERNVNTVFQDYALFPHLSVGENVAYGPMVRGVASAERRRLADEMLALVELSGLSNRRPAQLSGGQRQRVALARALVNRACGDLRGHQAHLLAGRL